MRRGLALMGALALALLLFWGLALMVAPPASEPLVEESTTLSVVDDVAMPAQASEPAPQMSAAAPPPPPPATPARPAPAPQPSPRAQSDIQLPDSDVADPSVTDVAMNESLPVLEVERPEPEPEPAPEPEPEPTPQPRPAPEPEPPVASAQSSSQQNRQPAQESGGAPQGAAQPQGGGTVSASPTSRVAPSYPMRARRRGQEGFVELEFLIQRDGSVAGDSIEVVEARPAGAFERAAREAVTQWRFEPREVPARTRQRLVFELR